MTSRRPFEPGDEGYFSIDDANNQLFWKDEMIQTESRVVLTGKQSGWAIVVAIAAIVGAMAATASAIADFTSKPAQPIQVESVTQTCTQVIEVDRHRRVERIISRECTREPA